jgi:phasin family protein
MFTNVSQMFDPTAATKMLQQFSDMTQFTVNTQKQAENMQKFYSFWTEACTSCGKQSAEMMQSAISDTIACMREIGTAKTPEEAVKTQATWTKKWTETCQTNAQQLAGTIQKAQTQCTDLITKMVSENIEATKSATSKMTSSSSNSSSSSSSSTKNS